MLPLIASMLLLYLAQRVHSAACDDPCYYYSQIIISCNRDSSPSEEAIYDDCVCNSDGFSTAVAACVACTGPGSAPAQFQHTCLKVAPDCDAACQTFGTILSNCGDTPSTECMCNAAYDTVADAASAFNEAFNDCVVCENGQGTAASWEETCCQAGYGCNGLYVPTGTAATSSAVITAGSSVGPADSSVTSIAASAAAGSQACATIGAYSSSCAARDEGFINQAFTDQASCLCYNSASSWVPQTFDQYWATCVAYIASNSPAFYASATAAAGPFPSDPCQEAGNVAGVSLPSPTSAAVVVVTSSNALVSSIGMTTAPVATSSPGTSTSKIAASDTPVPSSPSTATSALPISIASVTLASPSTGNVGHILHADKAGTLTGILGLLLWFW